MPEELGVSLHDPISIEVANSKVGKALEEIAASRNMASVVENGQILLTSTAEHRESLRPVRFFVADLTGRDAHAAADLAALLQRLVAPQSWQPSGGRGTVEIAADALRITQTAHVDYQIIVFCEKLRVARGLPTKSKLSKLDPKKFVLATRTARAKAILSQIVSVHASVPSSLFSILDQFKQPAGSEILIDRPALAAIGISESTTGKFKAEKLPLGEALQQLLEPLELSWRAVDASTLQITTQKSLATRMEPVLPRGQTTRSHKWEPARCPGRSAAGGVDRADQDGPPRLAVRDEGGQGGALDFDPLSQCLIVLQSQPMQRALEALLTEKEK